MKKNMLVLLALVIVGTLSAQSARPGRPLLKSVPRSASYGLFLNELDAAATVNETSKGPGFTSLKNDYLFAGASANPNKASAIYGNSSVIMGYYRAGNHPYSLFLNVDFSGGDTGTETKEDNTGLIDKTYKTRAYDSIGGGLQYLVNVGNISTGLHFGLSLRDGKDPTKNVTTSANTTIEKNHITELDFTVPFFMESKTTRHFANLSYGYYSHDESKSDRIANTDITEKMNSHRITASYELTMPLGMGELSPYIGAAYGFLTPKYEGRVGGVGIAATFKSSGGFGGILGCRYYRELKPTAAQWLNFRIQPNLSYLYNSKPYISESTIRGITNEVINKNFTHRIALILDLAMLVKPETWPIGFYLGSEINLSWGIQTQITGNKSVDKITERKSWDSRVELSYGFFLPLPEDYRLNFAVHTNVWEFNRIQLELIVPFK